MLSVTKKITTKINILSSPLTTRWNGTPLQYSGLENSVDRGAWQATVHGVAKSWTKLRDFHFTFNFENQFYPPPDELDS